MTNVLSTKDWWCIALTSKRAAATQTELETGSMLPTQIPPTGSSSLGIVSRNPQYVIHSISTAHRHPPLLTAAASILLA